LWAAARFRRREANQRSQRSFDSPEPVYDTESGLFSDKQKVWDEHASKRLLAKWHIPVVEEKIVSDLSEAEKTVHNFHFPVVLKGLLPGEVHKTELGLIQLGITTGQKLEEAYRTIHEKVKGRGRILIQCQVETDYELIAGFVRDRQFGPCVMFGLGGIFAELQPDVVFALAPLQIGEALELIGRIKGKKLLRGFRGKAPLNQERMAELLVNLGNLGASYSMIEQVDINPVAVSAGIPMVVDATIILSSEKNFQK